MAGYFVCCPIDHRDSSDKAARSPAVTSCAALFDSALITPSSRTSPTLLTTRLFTSAHQSDSLLSTDLSTTHSHYSPTILSMAHSLTQLLTHTSLTTHAHYSLSLLSLLTFTINHELRLLTTQRSFSRQTIPTHLLLTPHCSLLSPKVCEQQGYAGQGGGAGETQAAQVRHRAARGTRRRCRG